LLGPLTEIREIDADLSNLWQGGASHLHGSFKGGRPTDEELVVAERRLVVPDRSATGANRRCEFRRAEACPGCRKGHPGLVRARVDGHCLHAPVASLRREDNELHHVGASQDRILPRAEPIEDQDLRLVRLLGDCLLDHQRRFDLPRRADDLSTENHLCEFDGPGEGGVEVLVVLRPVRIERADGHTQRVARSGIRERVAGGRREAAVRRVDRLDQRLVDYPSDGAVLTAAPEHGADQVQRPACVRPDQAEARKGHSVQARTGPTLLVVVVAVLIDGADATNIAHDLRRLNDLALASPDDLNAGTDQREEGDEEHIVGVEHAAVNYDKTFNPVFGSADH